MLPSIVILIVSLAVFFLLLRVKDATANRIGVTVGVAGALAAIFVFLFPAASSPSVPLIPTVIPSITEAVRATSEATTYTPTSITTETPSETTTSLASNNDSSYTLNFGDSTYVDLDTGHADTDGGADDEVRLDFGRLFFGASHNTWAKTQVVYINDSQVSYDGCANGTLIQQEVAFLGRLEQDQTVCVFTTKGNWAAMKIKDVKPSSSGLGAGDITFDVKLFHPSLSQTPTPPSNGASYTLDFGDRTYVDLDTGHADTSGGADDELKLDFGRFFFGAKTQVVYIKDSQVSYNGCANGTLIQQEVAFLDRLEQDQTVCVFTTKGNWAAMKIKDAKPSSSGLGAGDITFDVKLFHP